MNRTTYIGRHIIGNMATSRSSSTLAVSVTYFASSKLSSIILAIRSKESVAACSGRTARQGWRWADRLVSWKVQREKHAIPRRESLYQLCLLSYNVIVGKENEKQNARIAC